MSKIGRLKSKTGLAKKKNKIGEKKIINAYIVLVNVFVLHTFLHIFLTVWLIRIRLEPSEVHCRAASYCIE